MTATDDHFSRSPVARFDVLVVVGTGLVFGAVAAAAIPTLQAPDHIEQVTIDNPHPWAFDIRANEDRHLVGAIDRETRQSFAQLIDQGNDWTFTFTYADQRAEVQLTADEMHRDNWTVTVPDSLAADLRTAGVAETPH